MGIQKTSKKHIMISVVHPPHGHRYLNEPQSQQLNANFDSRSATPRSVNHQLARTDQPFEALASGALPNAPMNTDTWGNMAQFNTDKMGRLPHQRESSLSSMGSTGPASPYNPNTSNPQIAITDSAGDELSDMHAQDAGNQNAPLFPMNKAVGNPYSGYHNLDQAMPEMAYPVTIPGPSNKSRVDRGLLPAADLSGSNRPHPTSVASSIIGGDSPATPTANGDGEGSENKRRKEGYGNVPKLDRTMTDVYGDELYSPNFAITSTPPSQPQGLTTISPPSEIFSQRLNAANSQHLGMAHSPASISAVDHKTSSPFRPSSPFAKTPGHDFAAPRVTPHNGGDRVGDISSMRQDAPVFRSQSLANTEPETPKTISPKDAMLEFNDPEGDADFPLFPQNSMALDMEQLPKSMSLQASQQSFMPNGMSLEQFGYVPNSQIAHNLQVPRQYPFVPRLQPGSAASPPRLSSSGSSPDSVSTMNSSADIRRPARAGAEGGTYTCTYHGCKLRFETPILLQKHKREGHRQTHGLIPTQPDIGMTTSLGNSQAGPHRCDRINPSTGKPCNTVFSRPYDLTRHEDTIHNARKQKVRCDLCTEEKTFSCADALTRHYRVCHPDMELPGKHRRRGVV